MEDFIQQLKNSKPEDVEIDFYKDNLGRAMQLRVDKDLAAKLGHFFTKTRMLILGLVVIAIIALGLYVLLPSNLNEVKQSSNTIPAKDTDNTTFESIPTLGKLDYKMITPTPAIATRCKIFFSTKWRILNCNYTNPNFTAVFHDKIPNYEDFDLVSNFTLRCANIYGSEATGCKVLENLMQSCMQHSDDGSRPWNYCQALGGKDYKLYNAKLVTCEDAGYPIAKECVYK